MHPTRQKLLDTGLAIATDKGLRGLTVRELAAAAEVNLGSFVYHFGNREQLVAAVLQRRQVIVEERRSALLDELEAAGTLDARERNPRLDRHGFSRFCWKLGEESEVRAFDFLRSINHPRLADEPVVAGALDRLAFARLPLGNVRLPDAEFHQRFAEPGVEMDGVVGFAVAVAPTAAIGRAFHPAFDRIFASSALRSSSSTTRSSL